MVARALPLEGISVLELGSSFAGPYATRTLGDLGATVIKVEDPRTGDATRSWGPPTADGNTGPFHAFNRGKRSITVDLGNPDEARRLHELIAGQIDVIVQNLRPGLASRFGFGEELTSKHPRLIYCNCGAYGREGPMSRLPGYDPLMQAFTGILESTGSADGPPSRMSSPVIDMATGMWAVIGVVSALYRRAQTGEGGVVDAALFETAISLQAMLFANFEAGGVVPKRNGPTGPMVAPNSAYRTADGLLMITAGTDAQFRRLCKAIERPDLAEDPRFAKNAQRYPNEALLRVELEKTFAAADRATWNERLNAADIANAPVQRLDEVVTHPQTVSSGMLEPEPENGFRSVALPLRFEGVRPAPRRPAPALGEGNGELLGE